MQDPSWGIDPSCQAGKLFTVASSTASYRTCVWARRKQIGAYPMLFTRGTAITNTQVGCWIAGGTAKRGRIYLYQVLWNQEYIYILPCYRAPVPAWCLRNKTQQQRNSVSCFDVLMLTVTLLSSSSSQWCAQKKTGATWPLAPGSVFCWQQVLWWKLDSRFSSLTEEFLSLALWTGWETSHCISEMMSVPAATPS